MIWLFHRRGEYVSCEVRTCLENSGFELLVARSGGLRVEWYPDELQVERRWERLNRELRREGWNDVYQMNDRASDRLASPKGRAAALRRTTDYNGPWLSD